MYNIKTPKRHWLHVSVHFFLDALILCLAFMVGMRLRFEGEWHLLVNAPWQYYPSVMVGALVFASTCYIFGFYAPQVTNQNLFKRSLMILVALGITVLAMTGMFYINFSSRVGRGIMLYASPIAYFAVLAHHGFLLRELANFRERVALLVTCEFDEDETRLFDNFWGQHLELAGVIHSDGYQPKHSVKILGPASQMRRIVPLENIDRVLCTNKSIGDPTLYKHFCELRYSGTTVMPLIVLCEEVYQYVPLELMTYEWLMSASGSPHMLYIKKIKRGFDIAASLAGLMFLGPILLLGMISVRLTSRGPIFYRQVRNGRFGRLFKVIKLRTMRVDAEKDGAVWSKAGDKRVTPVGNFLRKYRIDEIPQLLNVLRGDMSFVGPRPERPEFIEELARQIPFFQERLMIQPGLTGWAQVRFPYGATIEDTRRKLEFDLYYMKHMSLFLDLFILLDTVRIVLKGGVNESEKRPSALALTSLRSQRTPATPVANALERPAPVPLHE